MAGSAGGRACAGKPPATQAGEPSDNESAPTTSVWDDEKYLGCDDPNKPDVPVTPTVSMSNSGKTLMPASTRTVGAPAVVPKKTPHGTNTVEHVVTPAVPYAIGLESPDLRMRAAMTSPPSFDGAMPEVNWIEGCTYVAKSGWQFYMD